MVIVIAPVGGGERTSLDEYDTVEYDLPNRSIEISLPPGCRLRSDIWRAQKRRRNDVGEIIFFFIEIRKKIDGLSATAGASVAARTKIPLAQKTFLSFDRRQTKYILMKTSRSVLTLAVRRKHE